MQNLHFGLMMLIVLMSPVNPAQAGVSIGIGLPNVSIGINLPIYPVLVPVPGYPVYYAPQVDSNYFFYDGMYWIYQDDNWYTSSWYNGPWAFVEPNVVPLYILRIPVRYYRQPPVYFRGWQSNAPPRWGQHWGHDWQQQRQGWDRWNRRSVPARAPQPTYQRTYTGDRYPRQVDQQQQLRSQKYRYQPRDKAVRQHLQQQKQQVAPKADQHDRQNVRPQNQQPQQPQQAKPQRDQQPPQGAELRRGQQAPQPQEHDQRSQGRGASQGSDRDHGQGQGQGRDEERGRGRDK